MENTLNLTHVNIKTNGITLHVVQAGPTDGEIVILLHGFPEFWRAWIKQIPALVEAGYRVWIPDQRGYNLSEKPQARSRRAAAPPRRCRRKTPAPPTLPGSGRWPDPAQPR